MKVKELSVFFPAHNEEANIENTIRKAIAVLEKIAQQWEIIIVNDGSRDKTGVMAQQLAKKEPRIRIITHSFNRGYGEALKSGFYNSRYSWIVYSDADGQFDFAEINKFLEKKDQAQIVAGYRINRQDSQTRRLFGSVWTWLTGFLFGFKVRDVDCGFKLIQKKVIDSIPPLVSTRGGMISPELLARAKKAGFKIAEVGVCHYPRKEGKQSGTNLKVIFRSFADLGKLWCQLR